MWGAGGSLSGSTGPSGKRPGHRIASGHAYRKHVVHGKEFPGVKSVSEFATIINGVVERGKMAGTGVRLGDGNSTAYWESNGAYASGGIVVIDNPFTEDGGTAYSCDQAAFQRLT